MVSYSSILENILAVYIFQGFFIVHSSRDAELQSPIYQPYPYGLEVKVSCMKRGMNVSVQSSKKYKGALYAAGRFCNCHCVVEEDKNFWLFMPNPEFSNACNVIAEGNVLSAVVVLSYDGIVPYEVVTARDLFYRVVCNVEQEHGEYFSLSTNADSRHRSYHPSSMDGMKIPENFKARMDITRHNGKPVQNVILGDSLKLRITTNVEARKIHIFTCNATRVGGSDDTEATTMPLIVDGCSSFPQIISHPRPTLNGVEVDLVAFKLDGSDEVQLVCNIHYCPDGCPEKNTCGGTVQRNPVLSSVPSEDLSMSTDGKHELIAIGGLSSPGVGHGSTVGRKRRHAQVSQSTANNSIGAMLRVYSDKDEYQENNQDDFTVSSTSCMNSKNVLIPCSVFAGTLILICCFYIMRTNMKSKAGISQSTAAK